MATHSALPSFFRITKLPLVALKIELEGTMKDAPEDWTGRITSATIPGKSSDMEFGTSISILSERNLSSSAPASRDTCAVKFLPGIDCTVKDTELSFLRFAA